MDLYLNGVPYTPVRFRLRQWLQFEQLQVSLQKSDKQTEYADALCLLVSTMLEIPVETVNAAPWYEVLQAHAEIVMRNQVRTIPLTRPTMSKESSVPWEYAGREWYWWLHTFAKQYGWGREQVEELDIDDAVSLLQEILVEEQLQREFQWGLSELAYPYNETTKKHVFKPLSRPEWMKDQPTVILPAQKVKFPKSMLPIGRVIGEDDRERFVS